MWLKLNNLNISILIKCLSYSPQFIDILKKKKRGFWSLISAASWSELEILSKRILVSHQMNVSLVYESYQIFQCLPVKDGA